MEAIEYIRKVKCVSGKDSVAGLKLDIQQVIRLMEGYHRELVKKSDSLPCVSESYDFINPTHYKSGTKEVWEMMVDIWGVDAYIAHCEMCAFKYRQRLGLKPNQPIERDLDKAKWYETKANELRNSC